MCESHKMLVPLVERLVFAIDFLEIIAYDFPVILQLQSLLFRKGVVAIAINGEVGIGRSRNNAIRLVLIKDNQEMR